MGGALRLLAAGLLRSRVGVAALLAVMVFAVVGVARAVSGPAADSAPQSPARPLVTAQSTAGDDGPAHPASTPTLARDSAGAGPETVGAAFAVDWLAHAGLSPAAWLQRLSPRITVGLARALSGVDLASVPATRITGPATVVPLGATVAEVVIPIDAGRLRLRLVTVEGRWLVDRVDWDRA